MAVYTSPSGQKYSATIRSDGTVQVGAPLTSSSSSTPASAPASSGSGGGSTAKSGQYVEGNRINTYINGNLTESHVAGSSPGDIGKQYSTGTGQVSRTPAYTPAQVSASAPYYKTNAPPLNTSLMENNINARVYGPETRQQYEARQAMIAAAPSAMNAGLIARYGEDTAVVGRWTSIRDALSGKGKFGVLSGLEGMKTQNFAAPGMLTATGAAREGEMQYRNRLVEKFNTGTYYSQEEYDAALSALNAKIAPIDKRIAGWDKSYKRQASSAATEARERAKTAPLAEKAVARINTYNIKMGEVAEAQAYEKFVANEASIPGAASRLVTPMIFGTGVGFATGGPVGAVAGGTYGAYYGLMDVGFRVTSITGKLPVPNILPGITDLQLFPAAGKGYLKRSTEYVRAPATMFNIPLFGPIVSPGVQKLPPQSGTIRPTPTMEMFKAGIGAGGFTRVTALEDVQFRTSTASIMALGASVVTAEPVIGGLAKWQTQPKQWVLKPKGGNKLGLEIKEVERPAKVVSDKRYVFPGEGKEFTRYQSVTEQPLGRWGQNVGPQVKSLYVDRGFLDINSETGGYVARYAKSTGIPGLDTMHDVHLVGYKDIRVETGTKFGNLPGPGKPTVKFEDIQALAHETPGAVQGTKGYTKVFEMDYMGRQFPNLDYEAGGLLKMPVAASGKSYGIGQGVKGGGYAFGNINEVSLLDTGGKLAHSSTYVIYPKTGQGGGVLGMGKGAGVTNFNADINLNAGGGGAVSGGGAGTVSSLSPAGFTNALLSANVEMGSPGLLGMSKAASQTASLGYGQAGAAVSGISYAIPPAPSRTQTRPSRVSQITEPVTSTRTASITSSITSPLTTTKLWQGTQAITSVNTGSINVPVSSSISSSLTGSVSTSITGTITAPITSSITETITSPITSIFTQPISAPPPPKPIEFMPWLIPPLGGELPSGGNFLQNINLKGTKRKKSYRPDVRSSYYNIKGEMPQGILSGFELRPIPKKGRRKGFLE